MFLCMIKRYLSNTQLPISVYWFSKMARALVKTRKVGGSVVVRIPKDAAEQEGIGAGDLVELEVRKARKDWFGALKGVGSFSRADELDAHY